MNEITSVINTEQLKQQAIESAAVWITITLAGTKGRTLSLAVKTTWLGTRCATTALTGTPFEQCQTWSL